MSTISSAPQETTRTLRNLDEQFLAAYLALDVATLDRVCAPEFTLVHPDGSDEDKPALLARLRELAARGERLRPVQRLSNRSVVRVYGELAVVNGPHGVHVGTADPVDLFVTEVWRQTPPTWQLLVWHETRVRTQTTPAGQTT